MWTLVIIIGLFMVVGVTGLALGLSPSPEDAEGITAAVSAQAPAPGPSGFFVADSQTRVNLEILLARLEQHVRQERAAVETFHDDPKVATLRSDSSSPLAN